LADVDRFSKFFHQLIRNKYFNLTCNMLQHYLVKFENTKMLANFYVECDS